MSESDDVVEELKQQIQGRKYNTLLLSGKLKPPVLRNVLRRARLLELASPGDTKKVISICAGAGYGKTTLMAQVAREYPGGTVWYQLDEFDEDPTVFLRHLLAAASNASQDLDAANVVKLEKSIDEGINIESVLSSLISELDRAGSRTLFCFDDCHLLDSNGETLHAIKYFIKESSFDTKVMLASRRKVWHIQRKTRLQNAVNEIVEEDLTFSIAELEHLFEEGNFHSPRADVLKRLHQEMEGWIAGIILTKNYLRTGKPIPANYSSSFLRQDIYEYLAEEVLLSLPEQDQDLLIKLSLVDPIDPAICSQAFRDDNAPAFLRQLEDKHMFINMIGDTDLYRLHPLFREFLVSMLSRKYDRIKLHEMKVRLADAYLKHEQPKKAAELLLEAEEYAKAAKVVEDVGEVLLSEGEHITLERWLKKILPDYSSPALEMYLGLIYIAMRDFETALVHLEKAKKRGKADLNFLSRCSHAIADCYNRLNRPQDGIKLLKQLLRKNLSPRNQMETLFQLGCGYWVEYDHMNFDDCCARLKFLQATYSQKGINGKVDFLYVLKYMRQGNFQKAYKVLDHILNSDESDTLTSSQRNLYTNNMAFCLLLLGRYEESLVMARKCLERVEEVKEERLIHMVNDTLGSALIANGDYLKGEKYLRDVVRLSKEHEYFECLEAAWCHFGTFARRQENYNLALERHNTAFQYVTISNHLYFEVMITANKGADFLRMNQFSEAQSNLSRANVVAKKNDMRYALTQIDFHRAWHSHLTGDEESEKKHLKQALKRARENSQNHFLIQEFGISLPLLTFAYREGIETEYLNELISKINAPVINALEPLLTAPDAAVRMRALTAIGKIGDATSLSLLRRMLKDESHYIRKKAKETMASLRNKVKSPVDLLTPREAQILEMIANGSSNKKIANDLFISEATVKTHTNRIFRKLGLSSRVEAALFFREIPNKNFVTNA